MTTHGYSEKQLMELQAELEEMERNDPALKKIIDDMYDPVIGALACMERSERHHAARRAVGKRT